MSDVVFIVNPISGNGKKNRIVELLQLKGYKVVFTRYAGHAAELAYYATEDIVVAVGGDGTVNEVARGLLRQRQEGSAGIDAKVPALGIIPCGSGDGLARHLGISLKPEKALETIETGRRETLDCGMINDRHFFSVCGVGFDAMVSDAFASSGKRGFLTYIKVALKLWINFKPEHYIITVDGKKHERDAAFITAANSNQWGNDGIIAPGSVSNDGLLDMIVFSMFRTIAIPHLARLLLTGKIDRSRHFERLRGREMKIRRPSEGPAHFDGDYFRAGCDISIRLLPEHIEVIR